MTVAELRIAIASLPGEMRVMVDGYEGGFSDPVFTPPTSIDLNTIDSSVYGPHSLPGEGWTESEERVMAVVLSRNSR